MWMKNCCVFFKDIKNDIIYLLVKSVEIIKCERKNLILIISCIGDSLTEGDYGVFGKSGIANVKEKNYPYFLAQIMNCEVRNYGKCGANSTSYIEYYRSKKPDVTNSDIIIIMLGTNGGLDPEHDSQANTDFDEIVKACNGDEPKAEIILCTPPRATENPEYSNCGYMPIIRKAAEFIRNYAFNNKIHLIDIAKYDGFGTGHETEMQPNDGLHFGESGYKKLAEIIAGGIRDYQAERKIK